MALTPLASRLSRAEGCIVPVDFYAYWCQPCKIPSPILEQLTGDPATETASRQPLDIIIINSDTEEGELCQRFKVRALPTVVAFQGGKAIKTFTGAPRERQTRIRHKMKLWIDILLLSILAFYLFDASSAGPKPD
ncbi:hypothetical protein ARMGADRAFT_1063058 [Armillaria gallica]|uniref:Thioredoxin domain-containing protein n=1 Tax=Armillaria gallica TaxID=47427 RepID=A0A2H3DWX8_ARMGA|nr:hypothetical protein ARMGADRAFT_1063058 [Armillaria gallica]